MLSDANPRDKSHFLGFSNIKGIKGGIQKFVGYLAKNLSYDLFDVFPKYFNCSNVMYVYKIVCNDILVKMHFGNPFDVRRYVFAYARTHAL